MCETMGDHWGYAKDDLNFKSPATIIEETADCRRYGANMLLNIGPKGMEHFGQLTKLFWKCWDIG